MRALLVLGCAALLQAQPSFEVASVKANHSGSPAMLFRPSPGRFEAENQTVQHLLMLAYDVKEFQLIGGPGWINTEHYDLVGTAPGIPDRARMMIMLQSLLQDRFKLEAHRETRQLPIYQLTLAKGGPKIQAVKCFTADPLKREPPPPGEALCGGAGWGNGTLDMTASTLGEMAFALAGIIGRPIEDQTGVAGTFPIHLKFAPDNAPPDTDLPSVFTAVQEQLGLKLEPARGPVEVIVIDAIEKPREN